MIALAACGGAGGGNDEIIEIEDRFFILQTQDIMVNHNDYIGRTIRYQGMFFSQIWEPTGEEFFMVIRFTDDCCGGTDGFVGFEVYLGDIPRPIDNTWVDITGVLAWDNGFIRLNLVSLETPPERGEEFVFPGFGG